MQHLPLTSLLALALSWLLANQGVAISTILWLHVLAGLTFCISVVSYRLFLSPLAGFPGPKLAAATFGYEFYFDIWPHAYRYMWRIRELHAAYGPVVRINPIHLHMADPAFYDEIHPTDGRRERERCRWFSHYDPAVAMAGAMLQTMEHDFHRRRRAAVSGFFSKRSVHGLEPVVKRKIAKLVARLGAAREEGTVVNLVDAMSALTMDVISAYCFGRDMRQLDNADFAKQWFHQLQEGVKIRAVGRHFPWLVNGLMKMPKWLLKALNPDKIRMIDFEDELEAMIQDFLDHPERKSEEGHRTVFGEINSSSLPPEEKTARRLMAEASTFLGAGTETTGRTLAVTSFHLISQPAKLQRLREELKTVMPETDSDITLPMLEKLPYLTAVLHESLRMAGGVTSRMPRSAPNEVLRYKEWNIPRGTAVMSSIYLLHNDEAIFPNAMMFEPQRWTDNPELKKHLYAFGRGPRGCLGMNLAWLELYLTVATVFRKFDRRLHDTTEARDVAVVRDCSIGMMDETSQGIRVQVVDEIAEQQRPGERLGLGT